MEETYFIWSFYSGCLFCCQVSRLHYHSALGLCVGPEKKTAFPYVTHEQGNKYNSIRLVFGRWLLYNCSLCAKKNIIAQLLNVSPMKLDHRPSIRWQSWVLQSLGRQDEGTAARHCRLVVSRRSGHFRSDRDREASLLDRDRGCCSNREKD